MATIAAPNPSDRPLSLILENSALRNAITDAYVTGRLETANRLGSGVPNFHRGLFAFVVVNDQVRQRLADLGWTVEMSGNQMRFVAPDDFADHRILLLLLSGAPSDEMSGFKVNRRGGKTRFLLDCQNSVPDEEQPGLFEEFRGPQKPWRSFFLVSHVRIEPGLGGNRLMMTVYAAFPAALSADGTMLMCEDFEVLHECDLWSLAGQVSEVQQAFQVDPVLEELDEPGEGL
jgi:hypothetical protein